MLLECMVEYNPTAPLRGDRQSLWFNLLVELTHSDGHHSCYTRQILLTKQLVEGGVLDVNVVMPEGTTALHYACSNSVINLELIEFLLQSGADPNAKNHAGNTPLMWTTDWAPGAAKVLIEWPTTDVNILSQAGNSMLAYVGITKQLFSGMTDENPRRLVEDFFLLQQWLEVEEMLVERGAQ